MDILIVRFQVFFFYFITMLLCTLLLIFKEKKEELPQSLLSAVFPLELRYMPPSLAGHSVAVNKTQAKAEVDDSYYYFLLLNMI